MEKEPAAEHGDGVTIDFSAALGEAGHEVEDLGLEGVPDTGEVLVNRSDDDDRPPERDVFAAGFPVPIDDREPKSGRSESDD